MMYLVTTVRSPKVIIKAESPEQATEKFRVGMSESTADSYTNDPSYKVQPLTLELLDSITPEEFSINEDTSF